MSWKLWGEYLKTSHFSGTPGVFQPVTFNNMDQKFVLRAVRTWIILYNLPTFTSVEMRIYSNQGGSPAQLLYTSSNTFTRSQISTSDNAAREVYFEFDNLPAFNEDDTYHFVLWLNGYTDADGSHVAWKKDFPDPKYHDVQGSEAIAVAPYDLSIIGADL